MLVQQEVHIQEDNLMTILMIQKINGSLLTLYIQKVCLYDVYNLPVKIMAMDKIQ